MYNKRLSTLGFVYLRSPGGSTVMFRYYLLGGDTAAPSGLYARLCHAFLVLENRVLETSPINGMMSGYRCRMGILLCSRHTAGALSNAAICPSVCLPVCPSHTPSGIF